MPKPVARVVHWLCTCGQRGSYDPSQITTKTDAALPDAKHQKTCRGSVATSTRVTLLDRIATRVGAWA